MKIIFASDIHGSSYYLQKLLTIIEENDIEKVVFLGDYQSYSKELNKELIALLNSIIEKIIALKGHCDTEDLSTYLNFSLHNYYLLEIDNLNLFLTHGNINYNHLLSDNYILITGHTHQYHLTKDYINPGSITYPRKNKEHTYIFYENKKFSLYDIDTKEKIKELIIER